MGRIVTFLSNFRIPKFKMFNTTGNPSKHLAHYICCRTVINGPPVGIDALLLPFFMQSLEGVDFIWYLSLSEGIVSWQAIE